MRNNKPKNILFGLIAIIAGVQLPLAFAPFNMSIIAFIAPALLLALWLYATPKQAFWRGLLFGLAFFGFGVSWVYVSISTFGNAPMAVSILTTAALIIILAMFPALQGYILTKLFPKNNTSKLLLAFPASWVLFEWCRVWVLSGFPWLFLGYSQLHTPLHGIAPIFGVYGVSFAVALTSGALIALFTLKKFSKIFLVLIITAALWLGGFLLTKIHWSKPQGNPIQTTLIQGNISQQEKWQPGELGKILDLYATATVNNWDSKLIIWPEAAIPVFSWQKQPYLDELSEEAQQYDATIITGALIQNQQTGAYYNGMLAIGQNNSRYLKRHLVPLGEYPMFAPISTWIMSFFHIPMSGFTPGPKKQPPFIAAGINIAPSICYEVAYPTEILSYFPKAELLVNITDDSWFGKSVAPYQQLQMAQMRSLETARYQLIATNTGITAIVKPDGTIQNKAPLFKRFAITGKIYAMTGVTPWVSFGYYVWLILVGLAFIIAIFLQVKERNNHHELFLYHD